MANQNIDAAGLEDQIRQFQTLCAEESPDLKEIRRQWSVIRERLGQVREGLSAVMQKTVTRIQQAAEPPHPESEEPLRKEQHVRPTPSRHRDFGRPVVDRVRPDSDYKIPHTTADLKILFERTFGVGNKSLSFSDEILDRALAAKLDTNRGDMAVYCVLASSSSALDERTLERETGYNIGSVVGALRRLEERGLAKKNADGTCILV